MDKEKGIYSPLRRLLFQFALRAPIIHALSQAENTAIHTAATGLTVQRAIHALAEKQPDLEPVHRLLNPPELDERLPSVSGSTLYTQDDLDVNRILAFGDSIARGEQDQRSPFSVAGFIVRNAKRAGYNWEWRNEAWNGATAQQALLQIKKAALPASSDSGADIILSVGGNDIRQAIQDGLPLAKAILNDFTNTKTMREFAEFMFQKMDGFQEDVELLFNEFERIDHDEASTKIKRVFVLGLPSSAAKAETAKLPDNTEFPMDTNAQLLASKLIPWYNYRIVQAIEQRRPATGFDILFINTKYVPDTMMQGIHPTEQGQRLMAYQQLRRCEIENNGIRLTLLEKLFNTEDIQAIEQKLAA